MADFSYHLLKRQFPLLGNLNYNIVSTSFPIGPKSSD